MNRVTTINLNGRAYQLEEAGYAALQEYLKAAEAKLHDNPDKDEIMADFEQAIADKFDEHLSGHKNVVTALEVDAIIAKMGPVGGVASAASSEDGAHNDAGGAGAGTPKRLFQLREGSWIAGVCTGLAAYFGMDVTLMRVLFVLLAVFTHGFGIAAYIILMIVMPVARTDEEKAQARGAKPFNAHDFIEQAKSRYAEFEKKYGGNKPPMPPEPAAGAGREEWQKWKEDIKNWKRELKDDMRREKRARHAEHRGWQNRPLQNRPWANNAWQDRPEHPFASAGTAFFRFIMTLILIGLAVLLALTLWTFWHHATIFGFVIAAGVPAWVGIVFICALFYALMIPFKLLKQNARPRHWSNYSFFNDVVQSLFFVFALYLIVFLGGELFPVIKEGWQMAFTYAVTTVRNL